MIPNPWLFQQPWWLDITAGKNWAQESVETRHGALSFTYSWRDWPLGLREIRLPHLTPFLGLSLAPVGTPPDTSASLALLAENVPKLLARLPRHARFLLNFHPGFGWWSPFFWAGYRQMTRYTYRLHGIDNLDVVWAGFNNNARRNVHKAEKTVVIRRDNDARVLYDLFERTMRNQGRRPGYSRRFLIDLCDEVRVRRAGEVLIAEDARGRAHSGLLVVWHGKEAYYLVGGSDPEVRASGAMSLTMWAAVRTAAEHGATIFDFEGSMQKGIDAFIRNFGAIPCPYSQIFKKLF